MKLKNKYFILRHGQTIYQVKKKKIIYPKTKNPLIRLTKEGRKQVERSAKALKKKKIDLIFSSDFLRTRQTSNIVAKELGIKKVTLDKRLRDINLGVYHGKTKDDFYIDFPRDLKERIKRFEKAPKKGESWNDVKKRITESLKEIDKKHENKRILLVSHGDPLWLLEGIVKGWSMKKLLEISKENYIKTGEFREL